MIHPSSEQETVDHNSLMNKIILHRQRNILAAMLGQTMEYNAQFMLPQRDLTTISSSNSSTYGESNSEATSTSAAAQLQPSLMEIQNHNMRHMQNQSYAVIENYIRDSKMQNAYVEQNKFEKKNLLKELDRMKMRKSNKRKHMGGDIISEIQFLKEKFRETKKSFQIMLE